MSNKSKKIFLLLSIVVPFLLYCFYYYGMMVKNAPYKFAEFDSIVFNYGIGDSLINKYNSKTMEYQYVNSHDSLIKSKLKLNKDDLLYLHRKAADLGFWDFPSNLVNDTSIRKDAKALHYYIEFKYKRKTKKVYFDSAYEGKPDLKDAAERLVREIQKKMEEAEKR
ncbi:hypothetical protein [Mucilaginibacter paludis]|uniref:Uncharacterized protein n=1 Tax=Mucilaginibacter paludis DSM 18603 TaxID=714943 RepID=H1YDN9_9SPHI|nr:hypothetical protein [Mucilaginibacter paludis]EHQ30728.1 hypothetical protein Mucpa_6678 [Mucilaginibacter paludis DSM 18603]